MPLTKQEVMEKRRQKKKRARLEFTHNVRKRLKLVMIIFAVALVLLAIRLIIINQTSGDDYEKIIASQQSTSGSTIAFRRGTITDRNNTVLATSERFYTLILDPKVMLSNDGKSKDVTINALVTKFGFDKTDLETTVDENSTSSYVRYKKEITEAEKEDFDKYRIEYNDTVTAANGLSKIQGVWFEEEYKRVYPFDTFACSLLGFSGSDSTRGNWGIEEYYNSELVGINGRSYKYTTTDGASESSVEPAQDGNTIVSTIDYTIQLAAENAIDDWLKDNKAANVAAIVMDPNSGEILAMATDKEYDLNDPSNLSYMYTDSEIDAMTEEEESAARANMWKNFTIADAFEPGSTAKPFTIAAALEENTVSKTQEFLCTGSKTVADTTIACAHVHGNIDTAVSIAESCNSALMEIAADLGADNFIKYQTVFGLGRQTGIDLPGETSGLVYTEGMNAVDLACNSFGQCFTANMVQMAAGLSSLVNGGYYYQPHVVKQILSSDGQVIKNIDKTLVRRTVSKDTSDFIKDAMFICVDKGTGVGAQISGYDIGGKTGTAEKLPREDGLRVVSFVAAAPIDNPQVLIYVVVDEPEPQDGNISASIAVSIQKKILEQIIPYTNIKATDYKLINADTLGNVFENYQLIQEETASKKISGTDPGLPEGAAEEETTQYGN